MRDWIKCFFEVQEHCINSLIAPQSRSLNTCANETRSCDKHDLPLRKPNCCFESFGLIKLMILLYTAFSSTLEVVQRREIGL